MRKTLLLLFFCCSFLSVAETIDATEKERLRQEDRLEQERLQKTWLEKEENTKKYPIQITQESEKEGEDRKFFIATIHVEDPEGLLDSLEKERILNLYQGKQMGSTEIEELLVKLTNTLIGKGYLTSVATISDTSDMATGTLQLKILYGRIEDIVLNENQSFDKLKTFFLVPAKRGGILNIRDLDTATENFNALPSNHMRMEILPAEKPQYSILRLENRSTEKVTLSLGSNNHGEDRQNGFWRYGTTLNIDSPLGIGDRLYVSYFTVHRKNPDRSWKESANTLRPGEILPIGPPGYDPNQGEVLPYKRILDLFHMKYTMRLEDYTLHLGSSKTKKESSFYAFHTIYDMKSSDHALSANVEKILWRNQKSKLVFGVGIQRKHHQNYLEKAVLSDRILAVGDISLEGSTVLWKGVAGASLGYERGLRALGAERDDGKRESTPKAQFHKYTFRTNFYKPVTEKLDYRFRLSSSYSKQVLYGSEKQSIGGVGSVGGFHRAGGLQGDKALEIEQEISYKLWNSSTWGALSPYGRYAYGVVRNNANPSPYRKGHMSGVVLGLRYQRKHLDFDIAYARPLHYSSYLKPKSKEIYVSVSYKIMF